MESKTLTVDEAIKLLGRFQAANRNRALRLVVRRENPGALSGQQTTDVSALAMGIDWEAGTVIVEPAKPLTELSPEDLQAIRKSVAKGTSWHTYQQTKKLHERIAPLEAEVRELQRNQV